MAYPKYTPDDVNFGLIPKQWLNTPVMSFEDALMEQEKLQQAELANQINEQTAQKATRENESATDLAKDYETRKAAKKAMGEAEDVSAEEALQMVKENQLKYGRADQLANDELAKMTLEDRERERKRKETEPIYKSRSPYSDLEMIDPQTGEVKTLVKGKERATGGTSKYPKSLINLETGEEVTAVDPEDEAQKKLQGYNTTISNTVSRGTLIKNKEMEELLGTGKKPNPAGGKKEEKQEEEKPKIFLKRKK